MRYLVVVSATLAVLMEAVQCNSARSALVNLFKRQQDLLTIPVAEVGQNVHVRVGIRVQQIIELNEQEEVFRARFYLKIDWNDYRMKWNASDFSGVKLVHIHSSHMWTPDIYLVNNGGRQMVADMSPESLTVRVHSDGTCSWWPMFRFSESHCPIDVTWFPFDEQTCEVIYELYHYTNDEVNMTSERYPATAMQQYLDTGEWQLLDLPVSDSPVVYECCEAPFSRISFAFHLRRKPRYYVLNLVIPCCLFSFMALATFLLQPSCSERLGLSLTILLALSVYQIIVNDKLPASSDEIPVIGMYFFFVIVLCVLSAVTTTLVMHLHFRAESVPLTNMAPWLKVIICKRLASCLCMKVIKSKRAMPPSIDRAENQALKGSYENGDTAQLEKHRANNDFDNKYLLLTRICDLMEMRVRRDAEEREKADADEEIKNDWMLAAAVIDRFLFITFISLFIGGTFGFFVAFSIAP